jgi:hypothetical protein
LHGANSHLLPNHLETAGTGAGSVLTVEKRGPLLHFRQNGYLLPHAQIPGL